MSIAKAIEIAFEQFPNNSDRVIRVEHDDFVVHVHGKAIDAAQEPQSAWSGEGLPPVGTECEYYKKSTDLFVKAKIKYIGKKVVVIEYENGCEFSRQKSEVTFRPLKTERERVIDEIIKSEVTFRPLKTERERVIDEIIKIAYTPEIINNRSIMGALFDAGYRKLPEQQK